MTEMVLSVVRRIDHRIDAIAVLHATKAIELHDIAVVLSAMTITLQEVVVMMPVQGVVRPSDDLEVQLREEGTIQVAIEEGPDHHYLVMVVYGHHYHREGIQDRLMVDLVELGHRFRKREVAKLLHRLRIVKGRLLRSKEGIQNQPEVVPNDVDIRLREKGNKLQDIPRRTIIDLESALALLAVLLLVPQLNRPAVSHQSHLVAHLLQCTQIG